jgi:hypothetical protein
MDFNRSYFPAGTAPIWPTFVTQTGRLLSDIGCIFKHKSVYIPSSNG